MRTGTWLSLLVFCCVRFATPTVQQKDDHDGLFVVQQHGRYGFIDRTGTVVIPIQYRFAVDFAEGLAPIFTEGGCGYIDTAGLTVIPPNFKYCRQFKDGVAGVQVEAGWTLIDRSGQPITSHLFDAVSMFAENSAAVQLNGQWGIIDRAGTMMLAPQYRAASSFIRDRALVYYEDDWRCTLIDTAGRVVLQPEVADCRGSLLNDGLIVRTRDLQTARYAYMRFDGSFLTPFSFEWANPFFEGLASVVIDNRLGFIDTDGIMRIEPRFDPDLNSMCSPYFSEGLAGVRIGGTCGFVDRNGIVRIEAQFDGARRFRGGLAMVWTNQRGWSYVDHSGRPVWSATP